MRQGDTGESMFIVTEGVAVVSIEGAQEVQTFLQLCCYRVDTSAFFVSFVSFLAVFVAEKRYGFLSLPMLYIGCAQDEGRLVRRDGADE